MKTIISDKNKLYDSAAQKIKARLDEKPDAVLAFAAGRSMTGLFAVLADMAAKGEVSFAKAQCFAVTEYVDAPEALLCRTQLENELFDKVGVPVENRHYPDADAVGEYDARLAALGGIDLAVLGLGHNGHFGYNEPGTQYNTTTRVQKLVPATRRRLADSFGGEDKVPERAVTMGIKTLTSARDIIVIALGRDKAGAAFQMLYARDDSVIPAAFLQIPLNVTVLLDEDAAAML